ncbi:AAA family ATPase [Undibacterium sp.]|uniref:AAA family ATPase n=1 Tax=Undibacterium sp. TaxID=1914977 RepID=UPI00374DF38C
MYTKIWSTKLPNYSTDAGDFEKKYINLKRLNLFIGTNNSGKSRFIRNLFSSVEGELHFLNKLLQDDIKTLISPFLVEYSEKKTITDSYMTGAELHSFINTELMEFSHLDRLINKYNQLMSAALNQSLGVHDPERNFESVRLIALKLQENGQPVLMPESIKKRIRVQTRYYLPILRGMRPLRTSANDPASDDHYQSRTKRDYFGEKGLDSEAHIMTGLHLYDLLTARLLGQPDERQSIREYEELLGREFFNGQLITLIPLYKQDTVAIKIGNKEQRPIFDVGDGLQQVIMITSAAFLNRPQASFFIEEPELSMHPGLLRQLALFLLRHTAHQYFITTHSNHLLDLIEHQRDISIHKLSQVDDSDKFVITECGEHDKNMLAELGVRPSSVYLANCTIWVEGITDRLYLNFFMQKYVEFLVSTKSDQANKLTGLIENYHYAFVEYQGGVLGHWNFEGGDSDGSEFSGLNASRVCAKALVICDGDIKTKGQRYDILCEQLKDKLYVLDQKELENTLPEKVIVKVAKDWFSKMRLANEVDEIANLDEIESNYFKSPDVGIGRLLDKAINPALAEKDSERRLFATESGTIKDKVKFCENVLQIMRDEPSIELTPLLAQLCKAIFDHILLENTH